MDALSSLTNIIKPIGQVVSAGANLFEGYKQQQYQDKLRSLAQNPAKLNAYAQQFVQPLNAGLVRGVENQAQGYAAERGLAESPALSEEIVSQALGPYVQQNQQQGYQNALQALGLGGGANPPNTTDPLTQLFSGVGGLRSLATIAKAGQPTNLPTTPTDTSSLPGIPDVPIQSAPDYGVQDWYNQNAFTPTFGPAFS